jgi:hypothetical protein
VVVVSGTVVGTVSGVESATSGAMVSTTESTTVESLGTEFEPLGVSFSEQPANTPAIAAKPMILRTIFTTPQ